MCKKHIVGKLQATMVQRVFSCFIFITMILLTRDALFSFNYAAQHPDIDSIFWGTWSTIRTQFSQPHPILTEQNYVSHVLSFAEDGQQQQITIFSYWAMKMCWVQLVQPGFWHYATGIQSGTSLLVCFIY